jgi:hypothetical protein
MRRTLWIIGEFGFNIFERFGITGIGVYAHEYAFGLVKLVIGTWATDPEGVNGWLCLLCGIYCNIMKWENDLIWVDDNFYTVVMC